jgi:hypothetical protein
MVQPFLGDDNRYHYVYKITNTINQKIYIGKHTTKNLNDKYMGSGKIIRNAINKYGIDNFIKEYISFHRSSKEAYITEKKL